MDFFSHYFTTKKFPSAQFFEKCSGLRDMYTFLQFLSKRSQKSQVSHDLLYVTAIITYKICIPHFHFPVRVPARTVTKGHGPMQERSRPIPASQPASQPAKRQYS